MALLDASAWIGYGMRVTEVFQSKCIANMQLNLYSKTPKITQNILTILNNDHYMWS